MTKPGEVLGEDHWEELPYETMYQELTNDSYSCNDKDNLVEGVKGVLPTAVANGETANNIVKAYCHSCNNRKKSSSEDEYCNVLYYWIGDTLLNDSRTATSFSDLMTQVYDALKKGPMSDGCDIIYKDDNDKETFKQRKKVFEYHLNYAALEEQLGEEIGKTPCNETYHEYLNDAVTGYRKMYEHCQSTDHRNGEYCRTFRREYEKCGGRGKVELQCNKVSTSYLASMVDGRMSNSQKLPSERMYREFTKARCTNIYESVESGVKSQLKPLLGYDEGKVKKVVNACYYASEKGDSGDPLDNARKEFLFFWIGDKILGSLGDDNSFWNDIWNIYLALNTGNLSGKCPPVYTEKISRSVFNDRKKVFDYYYDHEDIGKKVSADDGSVKLAYCQPVKEAAEAYGRVQEDCGTPGTDAYCVEFGTQYKTHNPEKLWEQKCKSILEKERAQSQLQQHSAGKSYNLLPSWFGNKFGGTNRRERRSVNHHLHTFTDNSRVGDSTVAGSTTYSTEGSTICKSTIGSTIRSRIADNSTIYNERLPSRVGRTNSRQQQQNRDNISYGPM